MRDEEVGWDKRSDSPAITGENAWWSDAALCRLNPDP